MPNEEFESTQPETRLGLVKATDQGLELQPEEVSALAEIQEGLGADKIRVSDGEALADFREALQEQSAFYATPVEVRTAAIAKVVADHGGGDRFSIGLEYDLDDDEAPEVEETSKMATVTTLVEGLYRDNLGDHMAVIGHYDEIKAEYGLTDEQWGEVLRQAQRRYHEPATQTENEYRQEWAADPINTPGTEWTLRQFSTNPVGDPLVALQKRDQLGRIQGGFTGTREEMEALVRENGITGVQELPAVSEAEYYASSQGESTLLADAEIIQNELHDPATASEGLEGQAADLQRNINAKAAQSPSTAESATLRSTADSVETGELAAVESREELAQKAEVYAGLVARDYRTATDTAVAKFASGLRSGSQEIDLSQVYEMPSGVSSEIGQAMARIRHESVGTALQPLFAEAESLGVRVKLGVGTAESVAIEQATSVKRGLKVA